MTKTKKAYKNFQLFLAIFIGLFCVFFFTAYVTDDYSEKMSVISITWPECFKCALHYGNGRFLGNLYMLSSLRSDFLRAVLKPLIVTATIFCFSYLFEIKTTFGKLAVSALILIPAQGFFSYCFVKNPTFSNYVVPVCFFVICLAVIKYAKQAGRLKWLFTLVIFAVSVCMQLFSENSSVVFVIFALSICAYEIIKNKKISVYSVVFLAGAVIGLAFMLALPGFMTTHGGIKYDMSEYRNLIFNVPYMVGVLAQFGEIFSSSFIVVAFLSAVEIYLVIKESPDDKFKKWHIIIPLFYSVLSLLYSFIQNDERKIIASVQLVFLGLFVIFFANSVVIFFRFIKSEKDKTVIFFLTVLSMISVGMFTILSQHGYRTFYLSICLIMSIGFYILGIFRREYDIDRYIEKVEPVLNTTMVIASMCFAVVVSCQMVQNYDVSLMREYYIAEKIEQGETVIQIPKLPNKRLCREEFMEKFVAHMEYNYGAAEFVFVDMEEWELYNTYQSMQDNPITSLTYAFQNYNFNNPLK